MLLEESKKKREEEEIKGKSKKIKQNKVLPIPSIIVLTSHKIKV